jgi:excisionase family DNA binding protein
MEDDPRTQALTVNEAAALLRKSPRTVRRWLAARKLAGRKTPGGQWLVDQPSTVRRARGMWGAPP